MCEAHIEGNKALEKQECYDCIVLLLRRAQQLEEEDDK